MPGKRKRDKSRTGAFLVLECDADSLPVLEAWKDGRLGQEEAWVKNSPRG